MADALSAQCHCGAVAFTVELSDGFNTIRRCNCSFCRMRGAVVVSALLSGIKVIRGQDKLSEYRFNTGQAVHYFAPCAGFTLSISAAPIRINTALTSPVLKAFRRSTFRMWRLPTG